MKTEYSRIMRLVTEMENAAFDCGNWRKDDYESYVELSDKLREARAAVSDALLALTTEVQAVAEERDDLDRQLARALR